ncbi:hypothetical protein D3C73_1261170 [compost metagenome]
MPLHQLQRLTSPGQKLRADILALGGDHRRLPVQHFTTLPPRNLRCRPRRWQATGDFRAQRHDPTFVDPLLQ